MTNLPEQGEVTYRSVCQALAAHQNHRGGPAGTHTDEIIIAGVGPRVSTCAAPGDSNM